MGMYDVKEDSFSAVTPEMNEKMLTAINRTWDVIGGDWLDVCGGSCKQEDMLEGVMDANRMEDYAEMEVCRYTIWMSRFKKKEWKAFCKEKLYKSYGW